MNNTVQFSKIYDTHFYIRQSWAVFWACVDGNWTSGRNQNINEYPSLPVYLSRLFFFCSTSTDRWWTIIVLHQFFSSFKYWLWLRLVIIIISFSWASQVSAATWFGRIWHNGVCVYQLPITWCDRLIHRWVVECQPEVMPYLNHAISFFLCLHNRIELYIKIARYPKIQSSNPKFNLSNR